MPWEEIMNQIRLFYADMLDIVNACIFVLAQWSCLMKRCRRGGSKSRRIRCLTPQWSFHSNKKNVFRNCSLVTAAHSTQHFPASAASGCVSECMQFQLFIIIFVLTCVIDLWFFFQPMDRNILPVNTHKQTASKLFNPLTECPRNGCSTASKSTTEPTSSPSATSCSSSSSCFHSSIKKQEHHIRNDAENRCVFTALPHVADLTTYMIQNVISFSKSLQDFR